MARARVRFKALLQDDQSAGGEETHMSARVIMDVQAEGRTYRDLICLIKQTVGAGFNDPIEVGQPKGPGYDDSLNYTPFRKAVESYYRRTFSGTFNIGKGARVIMRGNTIRTPPEDAEFDYTPGQPHGW